MSKSRPTPLQLAALAAAKAVKSTRVRADREPGALSLESALRQGDLMALAQALARGADVHVGPQGRMAPLLRAVMDRHHETIPMLVAAGADPDALDGEGRPLLRLALERGPLASVQALVKAGASWERTAPDGLHSLEAALLAVQEPEVLAMLERPPSTPEAFRSRNGGSALHLAASGGMTAAVTRLLALGHPLDGWRQDGDTPLHRAVVFAEPEVQSILLEAGATLPPGLAKDAFHSAAYWGAMAVLEAGAAQGRDLADPALGFASGRGGVVAVLEWMKARGCLDPLLGQIQEGATREKRRAALAWLEHHSAPLVLPSE